ESRAMLRDPHDAAVSSYRRMRFGFRAGAQARAVVDSSRLRRLEQLKDSGKGYAQPVRTIIQFVAEFVECFFQQVHVQENVQFLAIGRQESAGPCMTKVRIQERRSDPHVPDARPWLHRREILTTNTHTAEVAE